jgi:hypothetical protein
VESKTSDSLKTWQNISWFISSIARQAIPVYMEVILVYMQAIRFDDGFHFYSRMQNKPETAATSIHFRLDSDIGRTFRLENLILLKKPDRVIKVVVKIGKNARLVRQPTMLS